MAVQGWRTRVYVEDFTGYLLLLLVLSYYISWLFGDPIFLGENVSLELLTDHLQEFGMFKYLLWPKFSQIFQKCSTKKEGVQPLDFLDKPIIVCYSSPASPPMLGRYTFTGPAHGWFGAFSKIATGKNTSERTFPQWPKDTNGFLGCAPQWVFG